MEKKDLSDVVDAIMSLSDSITPAGAFSASDSSGGEVASVTQALMGITSGLFAVAQSISELSDSISQKDIANG